MKKQKGIALITVLMVMALVAIIGVEMSKRLRLEVTRADRPHIDAIYKSIAQKDFSLRAAVHAIVAHQAFGLK